MRALLVLNPGCGRRSLLPSVMPALQRTLAHRGFSTSLVTTLPDPQRTHALLRNAVHVGQPPALVFSCGGDGTAHHVLQTLAGTPVALGVLPFGTANVLATHLGLSVDPHVALQQLLDATAVSVPLGRAETALAQRWFLIMAGAGPDGALARHAHSAFKARLGRHAYTLAAARLFLTRRFPAFQLGYRPPGSRTWLTRSATALLTARIPDLGGPFRGLTRNAGILHPYLEAEVLSSPAQLSFPAWLAAGKLRLQHANPWHIPLEAEEFQLTPLHKHHLTHTQVDAESLGPLPLRLTIGEARLQLLMLGLNGAR